jgi:hypothetical protein
MPDDSRQADTIEITPAMIEAGVMALIGNYDQDEDGIENTRLTVFEIIRAALQRCNHFANCDGRIAGERG